jgi:serine/threonine protein kinase
MGRVDEVFDRALGRSVAQKSVLPGKGEQYETLLVAEAQTCAQLEHPSIVPVYEIGADSEGNPHYTMRVVRGRTLRDVLVDNDHATKAHQSLAQLLGILRQVCMAVDFAHSRGVIHRDLKPENVLVGEFGEVYVLDWGVAHLVEGSDVRRATHEEFMAGSPGYMAPEQALGGAIGARTDVFALGVLLYEILSGQRPLTNPDLKIPGGFDPLVRSCLSPEPASRPASARFVADAIDQFLDGERARAEREKEANSHAEEGARARETFERLDAEARELRARGEAELAEIPRWESAERKEAGWQLLSRSRVLSAEAARALAHADTAFARALGRVAKHALARRGLAALHYRQFQAAEALGDAEKMAQYLDLARAYDDGDLALELGGEGQLSVRSSCPGVSLRVARFEEEGLLLRLSEERLLGETPVDRIGLMAGSYVLTASSAGSEIKFPLVVTRACVHAATLRIPQPAEIPDGMILIPGGPFLSAPMTAKTDRVLRSLPDYAMGRFPVTFREYVRFLASLEDPTERAKRSADVDYDASSRAWRLRDGVVEGEARARVPPARELDLPVCCISWYDAAAYARWLAAITGRPYRLPTDLEWEKAMRGVDGRAFPMGNHLDPSFAKLRESRPEASQLEPVGAFPLDESPYGVRDLAGGVGDWTSTMVDGAAPPDSSEEGHAGADGREAIWRGGAWSMTLVAPSTRYTQMLHHRVGWVGFRLALSLAGESSSLTVEPIKGA